MRCRCKCQDRGFFFETSEEYGDMITIASPLLKRGRALIKIIVIYMKFCQRFLLHKWHKVTLDVDYIRPLLVTNNFLVILIIFCMCNIQKVFMLHVHTTLCYLWEIHFHNDFCPHCLKKFL